MIDNENMDKEMSERGNPTPEKELAESDAFMKDVDLSAGTAAIEKQVKKSRKIVVIVVGIIIALIIVAIIAFAGIMSKPSNKILLGLEKTFQKDEAIDQILGSKFFSNMNTYSMDIDATVAGGLLGDIGLKMNYNQDGKKGIQSMDGDIQFVGRSYSIHEYLDDKQIVLNSKELLEKPLAYNYTESKDGSYLVTMMGEERLNTIDNYAKYFHSVVCLDREAIKNKMKKAFIADVRTLKFKKIDAKEIPLEEGKKTCKGYETSINSKFVQKLYDDMKDAYGKKNFEIYKQLVDNAVKMSGDSTEVKTLDSLEQAISKLEDLKLRVYLNDKKVVAMEMENKKGEVIKAEFLGKYVPWHKVKLTNHEETTTEFNVELKGDKEIFNIPGNSLSYDKKTGDILLKSAGQPDVNMMLKDEEEGSIFKINGSGLHMQLTLKDKAEVKTVEGTPVNLVEAKEDDIKNIATHVYMAMAGNANR